MTIIGNKQNTDMNMSEGILRQRRNLILTSLTILLFFLGEMTVDQINVLGTIVNIKSQSGVEIVLFILLIYFTWRYIQYYNIDDRAKQFHRLRNGKATEVELNFFDKTAKNRAKCFDFDHKYTNFKKDRDINGLYDTGFDEKSGLLKKIRIVELSGTPDEKYREHYLKTPHHIELDSNEIKKIEKEWKVVDEQQQHGTLLFETNIHYNQMYLKWIRLKSNLKFYTTHPYLSDYILPLAIAGIAFFVAIYKLVDKISLL